MGTVVWASIALDIQPTLVSVFNSISKRGFSFRIACIRCQIFVHQLPFDRHPGGPLPIPSVLSRPPVPPNFLSSPFFPQPFASGGLSFR